MTKQSDLTNLKNWLTGAWGNVAMVEYPYPANFLMNLPAWPIKVTESLTSFSLQKLMFGTQTFQAKIMGNSVFSYVWEVIAQYPYLLPHTPYLLPLTAGILSYLSSVQQYLINKPQENIRKPMIAISTLKYLRVLGNMGELTGLEIWESWQVWWDSRWFHYLYTVCNEIYQHGWKLNSLHVCVRS
mgnify:CR=1 FL=1